MGFRLAGLRDGRAVLVDDGHLAGDVARWWDLGRLTGGRLADPLAALADTATLHDLCGDSGLPEGDHDGEVGLEDLGPPVPNPSKVFAIGLNYSSHVEEMEHDETAAPIIFTKFPSCLVGPADDVVLVGDRTDYEVELVVVVGRRCRGLAPANAWAAVAGVTVGQDVSERVLQVAARPPQFSLAKSYDSFGPTGPAVVSTDLLSDPDDLAITCAIDGEVRQDARTSMMITGVPELLAYVSGICTLEPGDLVFTGTPAGVGEAQGRWLTPGQTVESSIEGVGRLVNRCA